jgi:hypothetical protein
MERGTSRNELGWGKAIGGELAILQIWTGIIFVGFCHRQGSSTFETHTT